MAKSIGKNAKKKYLTHVSTYKSIHIIYDNKLVKDRTRNGSAFSAERAYLNLMIEPETCQVF